MFALALCCASSMILMTVAVILGNRYGRRPIFEPAARTCVAAAGSPSRAQREALTMLLKIALVRASDSSVRLRWSRRG